MLKFAGAIAILIFAAIGSIIVIGLANPLSIARAQQFLEDRGYSVVFGDFANGNATVIVCASNVVNTEGCDHISDGTDDGQDFTNALADLPAGRTHMATIKAVGDFTFATGAENLPSYTCIDGYEATFTKEVDATQAFFRNADRDATGNTDICIMGGVYDGNKSADAAIASNARGLLFIRVDRLRIKDVEIKNMRSDCIRIEGTELGGTGTTRPYFIDNVYLHNCLQHGLRLMRSARNTHVQNVVSTENDIGLSIDHSEGNYNNLTLKDSTSYGLRVHNGHTVSLADLLIEGSGEHGAMLWGLVDSTISNWLVKDSSQNVTDNADYNTGLQWTLSGSGTSEYFIEIGGGRDLKTGRQWTLSGTGTNEYYVETAGGGDPGLSEPGGTVIVDGAELDEETMGSLTAQSWDYGDQDTLGFNTIYAKLTGGVDPDTATTIVATTGLLAPFGVDDDGLALTPGTVGSLAASEWAFDDNDSLPEDTIYVRATGSTDPDSSVMTAIGWSDIFWSNSDDESYGVNADIAGSNIRVGPRGVTDIAYSMYFEGNSEPNTQSPGNATADSNDNIVLSPVYTKSGISGDIKGPDAIGTLRILHAVEDGEHVTLWGREASGTATITGTCGPPCEVTVSHGLSETPVDGECWFIGTENPTNDVGTLWVDTYTATQMDLNVEADPGASNFDVAWFCETR